MLNYNLYYGNIQNIPDDIEFSFCEPKNNRVLIYSIKRYKGFKLAKKNITLSNSEKMWLLQSKLSINTRLIKDNSSDIDLLMTEMLSKFENELEKERSKSDGE